MGTEKPKTDSMICDHHKPKKLGYIAWHEWAQHRTSQKLTQIKCDHCKLFFFPDELNEPENPKAIKSIKRHRKYLELHPKAKAAQ